MSVESVKERSTSREHCPCHDKPHDQCPDAEPCLWRCGRKTTAYESDAPGYCLECATRGRKSEA